MDLESAAKAAAAIQTLDDVADACANGFYDARSAIVSGPSTDDDNESETDEVRRREIEELRSRHRELYKRWSGDEISPRQLRIELVKYYSAHGRALLDARFFGAPR